MARILTIRPVDDNDKSAFESAVQDIEGILTRRGAKRDILAMAWDINVETYKSEEGKGIVVVCNRMGT